MIKNLLKYLNKVISKATMLPLFGILFVICFVSIVYSSLNNEMQITGEAYVRVDEDIRITSLEMIEATNGAYEMYNSTFSKNTTSMHVALPNTSSTITYQITIRNDTDDYYEVSKVIQSYTNSTIKYSISLGDDALISKNSSKTFTIKFYYSSGTTVTSNISTTLLLQYDFNVKYYSIEYKDISDISSFPTKIKYGEKLEITLPVYITKVKVTTDGALLVQDQGYTFDNNVLTIDSVYGNIVIENTSGISFSGVTTSLIAYSTTENSSETQFGDFNVQNSDSIYSGNNGNLQYDTDGSLKIDETSPIADLSVADVDISDEYTIYVTVKGDANQEGYPGKGFPATIVAISQENQKYLSWFGFYKNYFNIHSFYNGTASVAESEKCVDGGFCSFDISGYSNEIMNIQISATRGGLTNVYINGTLVKSFNSGANTVLYKSITIGDLRPGRGLKFLGNIYDFAFYGRALTENEILENWNYAQETYDIN